MADEAPQRLIQNDTDPAHVLLSHISLERKNARPINEQLRNAIEQAIFAGEIPDESSLPSVRTMARKLNIAPNTVVRAYKDLARDGWLRADPKRGYFVTVGSVAERATSSEASGEVMRLIDEALATAKASGVNTRTFLDWVLERVRSQSVSTGYIAVVGFPEAFLEERVAIVQEAVDDLNYLVRGISMRDLESGDTERLGDLADYEYFLVPVGEVQLATELLGSLAQRIVPMTRTLRADVREFIASQPESTLFGVIGGSLRRSGRITSALRRYHPLTIPPLIASIEEPEQIGKVIERADVLVLGTRARPYFVEHGLPEKPTIETFYVPDERTLRKLRSLLRPIVPS